MSQGMEGERTVYREDCEEVDRGEKGKSVWAGGTKEKTKFYRGDQLCYVHPEDM